MKATGADIEDGAAHVDITGSARGFVVANDWRCCHIRAGHSPPRPQHRIWPLLSTAQLLSCASADLENIATHVDIARGARAASSSPMLIRCWRIRAGHSIRQWPQHRTAPVLSTAQV